MMFLKIQILPNLMDFRSDKISKFEGSSNLNTQKLFEVDYEEIGDGPTVLLLHSTATGARQWKHFINKFKERFHFVAVNLIMSILSFLVLTDTLNPNDFIK